MMFGSFDGLPLSTRIYPRWALKQVEMKTAIKQVLEEVSEGLSKKKLLKSVLKRKVGEDSSDENALKAEFEEAVTSLLEKGKISQDAEGIITVAGDSKKETRENKKRSSESAPAAEKSDHSGNAKKKSKSTPAAAPTNPNWPKDLWKTGEQLWRENGFDSEYLRTNPEGITRLFCGNLSKSITEEQLKSFIDGITFIKWITDKETKQFYGSTFIEVRDPKAAIEAVMKDKQKFMGRPLKIYYCPPRPGDVWPPKEKGGAGASAKPATREKTPKPEGCKKLYAGNLSYCIDDETMVDFFKDCGTLVGLRWLTRQGTEEFRVRTSVVLIVCG